MDLEVIIDGACALYKFDHGQTTFINKSRRLDRFLSTVTWTAVMSPIPGTTTKGKSGSLSLRLSSPLVLVVLIVLATVTLVL